jgi:hypothetical protein
MRGNGLTWRTYAASFCAGALLRAIIGASGPRLPLVPLPAVPTLQQAVDSERLNAAVRAFAQSDAWGGRVTEEEEIVPPVVPPHDIAPVPRTAVLRGVIGGPPWTAVIDTGGSEQLLALVGVGDHVSGRRVTQVTSSSIRLERPGSTVTLQLETTWR